MHRRRCQIVDDPATTSFFSPSYIVASSYLAFESALEAEKVGRHDRARKEGQDGWISFDDQSNALMHPLCFRHSSIFSFFLSIRVHHLVGLINTSRAKTNRNVPSSTGSSLSIHFYANTFSSFFPFFFHDLNFICALPPEDI